MKRGTKWLIAICIIVAAPIGVYKYWIVSYRYKLTLVIETTGGVKSGSSVVEATTSRALFPNLGHPTIGLYGEALYLDLGPGKRPLVALLTKQLRAERMLSGESDRHHSERLHWAEYTGPSYVWMSRLYNQPHNLPRSDDEAIAMMSRLSKLRGAREIAPTDLPDLVTFADPNRPETVIEVDPNNLEATLGPGVKWNKITLESTGEAVTTGIELKLPWLPMYSENNLYLNGEGHSHTLQLANKLQSFNFVSNVRMRKR